MQTTNSAIRFNNDRKMTFVMIRASPFGRLDARLKALSLPAICIYLAACIIVVTVLGVDGQYVASNNYYESNDVGDGGGGGQYYGLSSPQATYNMDRADNMELLSRYEPMQEQEQEPQRTQPTTRDELISSLIERWLRAQEQSGAVPEEAVRQADFNALDETSDFMKRQSGQGDDTNIGRDQLFYYYDANTHLPANSPYGSLASTGDGSDIEISGPVNDPEEFEAKLGQLTDSLNHKMSNTQERERLLLGLLNSSSADGQVAAADWQLLAGDQALGGDQLLQQDEDLIRELGDFLQLKLAELKGQSNETSQDAEHHQRLNDIDLDSSSLGSTSGSEPNDDNDSSSSESLTSPAPVSRYGGSEYIDHPLFLVGHQYVQGGAGEGSQLLGPEGTFENVQVIKTDTAIPSYCDPPNPCPIGYTAKDGCLENFVNSASFSREYQAKQMCSCDNEHSLFQCTAFQPSASSASSGRGSGDGGNKQSSSADQAVDDANGNSGTGGDGDDDDQTNRVGTSAALGDKLDTLARTIQNRYGDLASVQKMIGEQQNRQEGDSGHNQDKFLEENNYLVRSARKLAPSSNLHVTQLD